MELGHYPAFLQMDEKARILSAEVLETALGENMQDVSAQFHS
jgi:hypothetical protein